MLNRSVVYILLAFYAFESFALPMDWNGNIGFNTTKLNNFRRTDLATGTINDESQTVSRATGDPENASFQSYLLKLRPSIIVNDSVSFFGEVITGYGKGGYLGDSAEQRKNGGFGNALYAQNYSSSNSNLALTQFYIDYYTDSATYTIGRQPVSWGLGAIYSSGTDVWDRFTNTRDGITAKFKIGNFLISPYYSKIVSDDSLTKTTNTREIGLSLLFKSLERELSFGVVYGINKSNSNNTFYTTDINQTAGNNNPLNETNVKIIDIFLEKSFGKFKFSTEIPMIKGELGKVYNNTTNADYDAKAFIFETSYKFNSRWTSGVNFGSVAGEDGNAASFDATYLNPNYQVANILFRYNMNAIADRTQSIYDSYIHNAKYAKFFTDYSGEKWFLEFALIYAVADETAKAGFASFNHSKNKVFTANFNQEDDLGYELDFNMNYQWNSNVKVGANLGYHMVGDYFAFNNTASPQDTANTMLILLKTDITF